MKSADYKAKRHLLAQSFSMQDKLIADYEALESYCKGLEGQVMSPNGFSWKCRAEEAEKALEKERATP